MVASAASTSLRYEGSPKHKQPWQRGRKGSLCGELDEAEAQGLLEESEAVGDVRYAVRSGRAYKGLSHGSGLWHGFPVGWSEVPEKLRRKWLQSGRVTRREIASSWD